MGFFHTVNLEGIIPVGGEWAGYFHVKPAAKRTLFHCRPSLGWSSPRCNLEGSRGQNSLTLTDLNVAININRAISGLIA
jgi:hypothetical protein